MSYMDGTSRMQGKIKADPLSKILSFNKNPCLRLVTAECSIEQQTSIVEGHTKMRAIVEQMVTAVHGHSQSQESHRFFADLVGGIGYLMHGDRVCGRGRGEVGHRTVTHWMKCNSGSCYFTSVFCEPVHFCAAAEVATIWLYHKSNISPVEPAQPRVAINLSTVRLCHSTALSQYGHTVRLPATVRSVTVMALPQYGCHSAVCHSTLSRWLQYGSATVRLCHSTALPQYGSVTVRLCHSTALPQYGSATVENSKTYEKIFIIPRSRARIQKGKIYSMATDGGVSNIKSLTDPAHAPDMRGDITYSPHSPAARTAR
ncbi:hypothetical protein EVAR_74884_1 [Eumeta japonica]|uniref:Uncharacterized protein n=1 Tax=Eumeta variegata TaxID=151549 RepID=A0A4C1Z321_EUMVA|nr:hypothetical protein EVAR_74884_1 [Eumeta japonica]